jgi:hypothetical protein
MAVVASLKAAFGSPGQVIQRSARLVQPGGDIEHYFDESFRQLNAAITMPVSTVIGPVMDHVVVLLIGLPPSTPNPWSAQIRPNTARMNPTANVTTKTLLI